uniref:Uncharacterized protein n=1 Tax=viral metagenome TaxID=1070528 RepID=A0A6H1Z914_9ZZZZ
MTDHPTPDSKIVNLAKDWISLLLSVSVLKNVDPSAILQSKQGSNPEPAAAKRLLWHCWCVMAGGRKARDVAVAWLQLLTGSSRSTVLREIRRPLQLNELQQASQALCMAGEVSQCLTQALLGVAIGAGWMNRGTCQAGAEPETADRLLQALRARSKDWLQQAQEPSP